MSIILAIDHLVGLRLAFLAQEPPLASSLTLKDAVEIGPDQDIALWYRWPHGDNQPSRRP